MFDEFLAIILWFLMIFLSNGRIQTKDECYLLAIMMAGAWISDSIRSRK